MQDFEDAKDKVLMGAERRSMIMSDEDKRITAFHEAGHALVAMSDTRVDSDPVHKVTIIPRGMALGLTQTLPEEDRLNYTEKADLRGDSLCDGWTSGRGHRLRSFLDRCASNDLQQATGWARRMVTEYGMSKRSSARCRIPDADHGRLPGSSDLVYAEGLQRAPRRKEIDEEVASILNYEIRRGASRCCNENRDKLDRDRRRRCWSARRSRSPLLQRRLIRGERPAGNRAVDWRRRRRRNLRLRMVGLARLPGSDQGHAGLARFRTRSRCQVDDALPADWGDDLPTGRPTCQLTGLDGGP